MTILSIEHFNDDTLSLFWIKIKLGCIIRPHDIKLCTIKDFYYYIAGLSNWYFVYWMKSQGIETLIGWIDALCIDSYEWRMKKN